MKGRFIWEFITTISLRGDKAMKKEAKRKARIEQRRAKRSVNNPKSPRKS